MTLRANETELKPADGKDLKINSKTYLDMKQIFF
jgi:hypothetical protein